MSEQSVTPRWATVCIKLLQGPIYRTTNNDEVWNVLQMYQQDIDKYLFTLGLHLFVDVADGYAFLEQREKLEEESDFPKLIRETPLTIQDSLLCVLLREALDQFDVSQNQSANLVLTTSEIKDRLDTFFKEKKDQTRTYKCLEESLNRLENLTFIKQIETNTQNSNEKLYEVRRILKAKINVDFIKEFRDKLKAILDDGEIENYDL